MKANTLQAALDHKAETRAIAAHIAALNVRDALPGYAERRLARLAEIVSIGRCYTAPIICAPFTIGRRQYRDGLAVAA